MLFHECSVLTGEMSDSLPRHLNLNLKKEEIVVFSKSKFNESVIFIFFEYPVYRKIKIENLFFFKERF